MKECPVCRRCFPDHVNHCPDDGDATTHSIAGEPVLDGRYQLERRLGHGGMGVVFQARHIFLKTAHAIKVILPDLVGNDPMLVTRFRQEALAAAAIRHQNIIAVTDFGVVRATMPFLVMEFVNGKSLHDTLAEEGALPPARALEIISAVGAGVAAAHRQGIVHRDLKPLNIMFQEGLPVAEGLKVLDFGLAKIKSGELLGSFVQAKTSGLMGSPFYMAPEQWGDEEPDARADIYSLGVILFQMLGGDVPFKGTSIPSIMKKHLTQQPPTFASLGIQVPPQIEAVVRHALEKEAENRPASVEDFINELREAVASISASLNRTSLRAPVLEQPAASSASIAPPPQGATSIPPDATTLRIRTNPPHSRVYINNVSVGMSDAAGALVVADMLRGTHSLRIMHDGYAEWEQQVECVGGVCEVDAKLENLMETSVPPASVFGHQSSDPHAGTISGSLPGLPQQSKAAMDARRLRQQAEALEEQARQEEEEARRREQEERLEQERREQEERERLALEQRAREEEEKRLAEEERRHAEEQARLRAEAEARLKQEEEERRRAAEEEEKRRAAEAERLKAEEEERRLQEETRRRQEEEARLRAQEEERQRVREEEERRKRAEEEAARKKAEEEERLRLEEARKFAEAEAQRQAEEERLRAEEERRERELAAASERAAAQQREREEQAARIAATINPAPLSPSELESTQGQRQGVITQQLDAGSSVEAEGSVPGGRARQTSPHFRPASGKTSPFVNQMPGVVPAPQRKSGVSTMMLAAIVGVLLIGGGIGVWFMLSAQPNANMQPPNSPTPTPAGTQSPTSTPSPGTTPAPPVGVPFEMVMIPGGRFRMGRDDGAAQEGPVRNGVGVGDFFMDKTEVTNAEYANFVRETGYQPPSHWSYGKPDPGEEMFPVTNVSYQDAVRFAEWRSKRDRVKYRLPTEEEWEYAARGGDENNLYPWGNGWVSGSAGLKDSGATGPKPVGSYPADKTRWGVLDMAGNVYEWTSSRASLYPGNQGQLDPTHRDWIIVRGGAYVTDYKQKSPTTYRDWFPPSRKEPVIGFRLVRVGTPNNTSARLPSVSRLLSNLR